MSPIILRELVKIEQFSHVNEREIEELPNSVLELRALSTMPDPQGDVDPQEHEQYFTLLYRALTNYTVVPYLIFKTKTRGAWDCKRLDVLNDNLRDACQGQKVVRLAYLSREHIKDDLSILVDTVPELARESIR